MPAATGQAQCRKSGTAWVAKRRHYQNGKVKAIYDLQGRKIENPTKGIYIIDGKKTLVK